MMKHGYIGEFEVVDDHRGGKIVVNLTGRLNKVGVISPRFDVGIKDIEKWTNNLLPSRQFGYVFLFFYGFFFNFFYIIFTWNEIHNDLYKYDDKLELIPWHVLWLPMIGLKFPKNCKYFHVKIWKKILYFFSYFSYIVMTTSGGIMDHEEARRKHLGGKIMGFFF